MGYRKQASKIFYRRAGTVFLALFILLGVVLCLTVREYTANAYLSFYPEAPKPLSFPIDTLTKDSTSVGAVKEISREREVELVDSCKADAVKFLRQRHIIKGAAISAMKGDFDSLLLESISNPASSVHKRLRGWHHSESTRAMIKLLVMKREDGLRLNYFTYDSLSTASTVNYLVSMLKEKSLEYEAVGVKMKLSATKFKATVPWRLVIAVRIALFALLFLVFLLSKIVFSFMYKQKGFVSRKKAEKALGFSLFGTIGEPSTFNDKYLNAERWVAQNAFIAEKISTALNGNKKFINIFSLYEGTLEKLLESGFLMELRKRFKFNVLGGLGSEALNPDSPSYRFPDVERFIKESGDRPMVVIHPALSSSSVPAPFLENAAFNLMVTDAKDGWDESASAIHSYVPGCEVVMTGLPMSECLPVQRSKRKALKEYPKATERYSFLVLLTECYTKLLTERTVQSFYESTGATLDSNVQMEDMMKVELDGYSYRVQPFRQRTANVLAHSLGGNFVGVDYLVVIKAGCKVSAGFFENLAAAAASGVKCMQCRLVKGEPKKGRRPKSYKSIRMRRLRARYGLSAELQESGFAVATKLAPQCFIDYLNNTYVFFL